MFVELFVFLLNEKRKNLLFFAFENYPDDDFYFDYQIRS